MLGRIIRFLRRIMFVGNNEDELDEYDSEEDGGRSYRIISMEPRNEMECREPLVEALKRNISVVVNVRRLSSDKRTEVTEYLKGAVFALGGSITDVDSNTFLITPSDILREERDND